MPKKCPVTLTQVESEVDPAVRPLHERLAEAMERLAVPGVAVGLLHEGREHVAGFGVTNVDHPSPVGGNTLFQIGSTTKTVTATTVMRLVEDGKIDLDTPVRAYLPDLRLADETVAAGVTMRHLLTHTGGWSGDYFANLGRGDDALAKIVAAMADVPHVQYTFRLDGSRAREVFSGPSPFNDGTTVRVTERPEQGFAAPQAPERREEFAPGLSPELQELAQAAARMATTGATVSGSGVSVPGRTTASPSTPAPTTPERVQIEDRGTGLLREEPPTQGA